MLEVGVTFFSDFGLIKYIGCMVVGLVDGTILVTIDIEAVFFPHVIV